MNEEPEKQAYDRGKHDQQLENAITRIARLEKFVIALGGLLTASWAKITGFFP